MCRKGDEVRLPDWSADPEMTVRAVDGDPVEADRFGVGGAASVA
jgi:hypothetical protein